MAEHNIRYALPITAVRITGTKTTITDQGPNPNHPVVSVNADSSVELTLIADPTAQSTVRVKHGWLFQTNVSFALSDDGRLTSATSETTGEIGTLVRALLPLAQPLSARWQVRVV